MPRHPYKSNHAICAELEKGPKNFGNLWKASGIKSRGQFNKRLQELVSKGLVIRERRGKQTIYKKNPSIHNLIWESIGNKPLSKKEMKSISSDFENLTKVFQYFECLGREIKKVEKLLEDEKTNEFLDILQFPENKKAEILVDKLRRYVKLYADDVLCRECLKEGKISKLIYDHNRSEKVCRRCGVVYEDYEYYFQ